MKEWGRKIKRVLVLVLTAALAGNVVDPVRGADMRNVADGQQLTTALAENTITAPLDFANVGNAQGQTPATGPGYRWSGDAQNGYRLELNGFQMDLTADSSGSKRAISLPLDGKIVIEVAGENEIIAPDKDVFWAGGEDEKAGESITVQGTGTLTTDSSVGPFWLYNDLYIKDVTIRAKTEQSGICSRNGSITLDSVDFQMESAGISASCIWTSHGAMTIQNSTLYLKSNGDRGIFVRDGDLNITDSDVDISTGYECGISVGVSMASTGGNGYKPGITPGQDILISGNSNVSIVCTDLYGIYLQGNLIVDNPARLAASGTSAALVVYEGITLKNTAVISPQDGIITIVTPPSGSNSFYTVRSGENIVPGVEIASVNLDVSLDQTAYVYGDSAQSIVTAAPAMPVSVFINSGEEQVGTGSLGDGNPIMIDTRKLGAGNHTLTVKLPEDKGNVSKDFTLAIEKATPAVSGPGADVLQYGQKLYAAALAGGTAADPISKENIDGTWSWKDGEVIPTVDNSGYAAVFTPVDTANYHTVEMIVAVSVEKAPNAPNMPESAMEVSNRYQKVSEVVLPEGWKWQDVDQDTVLTVGIPVNAVAVYNGTDKGNYENEMVTVVVTRLACDHVAGDILYTGTGEKAPTCTEDGVGHRECTKCGSVLESGITEKALGHTGGMASCTQKAVCTRCGQEYGTVDSQRHDYKEEITQKPTVERVGVKTYTCFRCGTVIRNGLKNCRAITEAAQAAVPEVPAEWVLAPVAQAAVPAERVAERSSPF